MDLWEKFGMSEGIAGLWQELGISAGTAIVVLVALYFVIKWAVKNGIIEACKKIEEKKLQDKLKAEISESEPGSAPEKNEEYKKAENQNFQGRYYEKY